MIMQRIYSSNPFLYKDINPVSPYWTLDTFTTAVMQVSDLNKDQCNKLLFHSNPILNAAILIYLAKVLKSYACILNFLKCYKDITDSLTELTHAC